MKRTLSIKSISKQLKKEQLFPTFPAKWKVGESMDSKVQMDQEKRSCLK